MANSDFFGPPSASFLLVGAGRYAAWTIRRYAFLLQISG